jgi:Fe-S cluster assembly scaffold protein SufB
MEILDIEKLKTNEIINVDQDSDYFLTPKLLTKISLKKDLKFCFNNSNISSNIVYRCIANKGTNLDLNITLLTKKENIHDVDVSLEVYVLNLSEENVIKVSPILLISQKNVKFEHKVTIGTPNDTWISYLKSRGLSYRKAINLISKSFTLSSK